MSCECDAYVCLTAKFNPCAEGVAINVEADETGVWTGEMEFNGVWTAFAIGVDEGERIILPVSLLNERYDHILKIYNEAGVLFGCYTIQSRAMGNAGEYAPVAPVALTIFELEVTEETSSITDIRLKDKKLALISTQGQSYNSAFWSKPLNSDTVTSTILTFAPGNVAQTLTFITR